MNEIENTDGVAAYTGIPRRTLDQWRYLGRGPAYIKAGGHVLYRKADVDLWLAEQTVIPTTAA